jgi:hypothetical protein
MNTRKHRPILLGQSDTVYEQQVQQEIETYLNALNSYPGRFEQEPCLSFEQYLFSMAMANQAMETDRGHEEEVA